MGFRPSESDSKLGSLLTCQKCGVLSYPPFYACKRDCPLTVSEEEKDKVHNLINTNAVQCQEKKMRCRNKQITGEEMLSHFASAHQMKTVTFYPLEKMSNKGRKLLGRAEIAIPVDNLKDTQQQFRWPAIKISIQENVCFVFNGMIDPVASEDQSPSSSITSNSNSSFGFDENKVHFWLITDGPEEIAKMFAYSISFSEHKNMAKKQKKRLCIRPVRSWMYYDFERIRSRRETLPFPLTSFLSQRKSSIGKEKKQTEHVVLSLEIFNNV